MGRAALDHDSIAVLAGIVQARCGSSTHQSGNMHATSILAYAVAAALLFVKLVVVISVQGLTRMRTRTFQYPEDAGYWGGRDGSEDPVVVRAQRVLRNDSEGQPLFLALGAAYVLAGATPLAAPVYFGVYVASRLLHAWFLLRPRQPHRNRAFGVGIVTLSALAIHTVVRCIELVE